MLGVSLNFDPNRRAKKRVSAKGSDLALTSLRIQVLEVLPDRKRNNANTIFVDDDRTWPRPEESGYICSRIL